ncbi:MAG: UviB-like protein [Clostridiales bacterium]|jgi:hypothetical protein|nr:UviB-like protein [Clostridiales bacterium]
MLWDEIIKLAVANGLFAVLFVALLLYVLKDGRVREQKYQSTIAQLSTALGAVKEIKTDVESIKEKLFGGGESEER